MSDDKLAEEIRLLSVYQRCAKCGHSGVVHHRVYGSDLEALPCMILGCGCQFFWWDANTPPPESLEDAMEDTE